jgi:alpha-galactosidase
MRLQVTSGKSVVYAHYALGSKIPFYIGHGSIDAARPFRGGRWRTAAWRKYVDELGDTYEVEILSEYDDKQDAINHELELISQHRPVINVAGMR